MSEYIITQTVSPKNYCKSEHTMCEFANDRGYCVKTGCSKRIIINDRPVVNKNLVEVVRCKDCKHNESYECTHLRHGRSYIGITEDFFCADGERHDDDSVK